jgi:uncharacterized RDD family membrane protein YckC
MRASRTTVLTGLLALGLALATSRVMTAAVDSTTLPESEPAATQAEDVAGMATETAEPAPEETLRHVGPKVAVGNSLQVGAGEVAEAVVVVNGSANVDGDVQDAVVTVLGQTRVNGKVQGDVVAVMSDLEFGPKAEVSGQVVRIGGTYKKDPGAVLHQEDTEVAVGGSLPGYAWFENNVVHGVLLRPFPPRLAWAWAVGLAFMALHFVVLLLMARPVQACSETLRARPVRSFFVGFMAYVLFLPLLVLLSWTVIGVPVLICALIGAGLVGKTVVYRVAGGQLLQQVGLGASETPLLGWLVGTVALYVLYMIPVLGWVVWFILVPLGLGAVVTASVAHFQRERVKSAGPELAEAASAAPLVGAVALTPPSPLMPPLVSQGPSAEAAPTSLPPLTTLPPITGMVGPSMNSAELASLPRAGFWPRLGATVLDYILLGIICAVTWRNDGFFLALVLAYHIGMWVWKGATLGGAIFGLKCVRLDGRQLDWQIGVVRAIASFVSLAPCGLGFFWTSWTRERQSWHDIIAGTTIVKLPKPFSLI